MRTVGSPLGLMRGGCLCGAVRFEATGRPVEVIACHCSQCRRTTGNFAVSAEFEAAKVAVAGEASLRWHRSSPIARRAFCAACGSRLFWREDDDAMLWIAAGTFDDPAPLQIEKHIFVADKPDSYNIADGKPQFDGYADTASESIRAKSSGDEG